MPSRRSTPSRPTAPSCTPTATGCSARSTMPRTRSRTRCCAPGAGCAGFEGRSSLRSWLYTIATNACLKAIERRPKLVLPVDYGPAGRPARRPGRAARRVGLDRAVPGRAARPRGRLRRARGSLRAARERRARVHRGAPAPAGAPARRADPARGARLLGRRGRRRARHDAGVGVQRSAARAQDRRRAAPRAEPAGRRCARSATTRCARSSTATSPRGSAATSTPSSRCWPRTPCSRCRRCRPGIAGRDAVAGFLRPCRWREGRRWRVIPARASGQPALGYYLWERGERQLPPARHQRAHAGRRADRRDHGLPHAGDVRALRPARRDRCA